MTIVAGRGVETGPAFQPAFNPFKAAEEQGYTKYDSEIGLWFRRIRLGSPGDWASSTASLDISIFPRDGFQAHDAPTKGTIALIRNVGLDTRTSIRVGFATDQEGDVNAFESLNEDGLINIHGTLVLPSERQVYRYAVGYTLDAKKRFGIIQRLEMDRLKNRERQAVPQYEAADLLKGAGYPVKIDLRNTAESWITRDNATTFAETPVQPAA